MKRIVEFVKKEFQDHFETVRNETLLLDLLTETY